MNARLAAIGFFGVLGWLVSYAFFIQWVGANGLDMRPAWVEAFTTSLWATGLLYDLVAVTFMVFTLAFFDRERIGIKWAVAMVLLTTFVSVSMGLLVYFIALARRPGSPAVQAPGPAGGD